jgi:mono/diheme cytochrome c family protein
MKRSPLQLPNLLLAFGLLALLIPASALAGGDAAEGKKTYDVFCMVCHGHSGGGDGPVSMALDPPPRNFTTGVFKFDADKDGTVGTDEDLAIAIRKGGAAFGGNPVMVPWLQLSDAEISHVIAYIRTLATAETASE